MMESKKGGKYVFRVVLANIFEYIMYLAVLFSSMAMWIYFNSLLYSVLVGVSGVAITWILYKFIEGKPGVAEDD